MALFLLVVVLLAVPAPLDRRRQASTGHNILPLFRVCAVPFAAVCCAGLPHAHHLAGAAAKHALAWTATVFHAETLALRVGGAARHGARLLLSAAVFAAMQRPKSCVGGAPCNLARFICTVLGTDTTCFGNGGAAFLRAHFPAATAVLAAPASGLDSSGALVERAEPFSTVFVAKPLCFTNVAAAFHRARHCLAVVLRALSSNRDGVGNARVQGAVSIGAVLHADKLAEDLRGLAVWIGAGQLHRVLAAQATFLHRGGGATFSKTLA